MRFQRDFIVKCKKVFIGSVSVRVEFLFLEINRCFVKSLRNALPYPFAKQYPRPSLESAFDQLGWRREQKELDHRPGSRHCHTRT